MDNITNCRTPINALRTFIGELKRYNYKECKAMNISKLILNIIVLLFLTNSSLAGSSNWITYYYLAPSPDKFVEETIKLSKSGALSNRNKWSVITFLSQLFAQNPKKTKEWLSKLSTLPNNDKEAIYDALWLSQTKEAKSYLKSNYIFKYSNRNPPNVLTFKLTSPAQMDMLWAYFFATGQKKPIRRIISVLNYYKYNGAIDSYKSSNKTKEDRQKALYETMFKSAVWSLKSNAKQHKKVKKTIEEIFNNEKLSENEKLWLIFILNKLEPSKYKIKVK